MIATFRSNEIERFRSLVTQMLGLHFDESKTEFLANVLRRRVEAAGGTTHQYLGAADTHSAKEVGELARELTVGETYFFRNKDQFRAFSEVCVPVSMGARRDRKTISVLSAGCASGEEAYTIAILLRELVADLSWTIKITGIDLNPGAIEKAKLARYSPWALRETTPDVQRRWFQAQGREWTLDASVRDAVDFQVANLMEDNPNLWAPASYDVVFCRNVTMYFTAERAAQVVARIYRSLVPSGFLFLGHAETLRSLSTDFRLRHTHETFYYQRSDESQGATRDVRESATNGGISAPPIENVPLDAQSWIDAIARASERIEVLAQPKIDVSGKRQIEATHPDLRTAFDLLRQERYSAALDLIAAQDATDPDVVLLRAVLLIHGGDLATAETECRKLLAIDELHGGAHYLCALCREGVGDYQGAIEHDQTAAYLDDSFAMPRIHLGIMARKRGDNDVAQRELAQALILLQQEDSSKLLLFGGGFSREALVALCRAEMTNCKGTKL